MKESGKEYGLPFFYFHSFCQDCQPIHPENHMQKGFLLFLHKRLVIRRPVDHR
jgi:hypothetical protein